MKFTYPKNIRFRCLRCGLCCGDTENRVRNIMLMKNEANRISQKTSRNVEEFAEEIEGFEPYIYTMKKTKEGKCVFLKEDLCTIYPIRPLICRFYPFEFKSNRNNRYMFTCTDECPGIGKGSKIDRRFFDSLFRRLKKQVEGNSA